MFNKLNEECGVFAIYSNQTTDVALSTYYGLYALQHRGQEGCGIVVNDDGVFNYHKDIGLVNDVFSKDVMAKLGQGNIAIGHVRYATTGSSNRSNTQPLVVRHTKGPMSIAHNGNLTNAAELREQYELRGGIFHTTNDTEVISYAITEARLKTKSIQDAVEMAVDKLQGSFSIVVMSPRKLIAARDKTGFRPLCIGQTQNGEYVVTSETCALDSINATFVRDIQPGEIVMIDENGLKSIKTYCGNKGKMCVFEYVYFARPDSVIQGFSVHQARINAGITLAKEHPVDADVVIGVPDSGLDAAIGYSRESNIPYEIGFIKNKYIGRTFIAPTQTERENAVRIKLNVITSVVKDKRVVLIDDSIVRGTTSGRIAKLLYDAGAKEVHMRISSPPFTNPCYFGTDIDSKENLIACKMSIPEIADFLKVDTLGYLSVDGVNKIAEGACTGFCDGCFTGNYPIEVPKEITKNKFEKKIEKKKGS